MHQNLGGLAYTEKRWAEAFEEFRTALQIHEHAYAREDAGLVAPLLNLGSVLCKLGRADEAVAHLERALRITVADRRNSLDPAQVKYELAIALGAARRDPDHAILLMSEAQTELTAAGATAQARDAGLWLAAHSRRRRPG